MTIAPPTSGRTFDLPPGLVAAPQTERRSAPDRDDSSGPRDSTADARPDSPPPGPAEIAVLVRAVVEIVRGHRSPHSIADRLMPDVLAMLARRAELGRRLRAQIRRDRPDHRMQVSGVRTCEIGDAAVEASAVVREPGRARAVALRLEHLRSGWRIVALEFG